MAQQDSSIEVALYDPGHEAAAVFAIWDQVLGHRWSITLPVFREVTEAVYSGVQTHQLVGRDRDGTVIGYLASQIRARRDDEASIVLAMVRPDYQRRGIGTNLINAALAEFGRQQITTIHIGANSELPFWHGIPTRLPGAREFFEKCGWEIYEKSYDLLMDLKGFSTPEWVRERPRQHGVQIRQAVMDDMPGLLAFLREEFPSWHRWFEAEARIGEVSNIVVARSESEIVGCVHLSDVRSPHWTGRQWRTFLGEDMGALGAVGVKASEREKGIGLAMVAEASSILRARGIRNCFVHWTWLVDWYGRLGYAVFDEYWMGVKGSAKS